MSSSEIPQWGHLNRKKRSMFRFFVFSIFVVSSSTTSSKLNYNKYFIFKKKTLQRNNGIFAVGKRENKSHCRYTTQVDDVLCKFCFLLIIEPNFLNSDFSYTSHKVTNTLTISWYVQFNEIFKILNIWRQFVNFIIAESKLSKSMQTKEILKRKEREKRINGFCLKINFNENFFAIK